MILRKTDSLSIAPSGRDLLGRNPSAATLADFVDGAYAELRRVAASLFKQESGAHTLQPTELVHEMFIRLKRPGPQRYVNRAQFFACAVRVMRQILADAGRKRTAQKRGGRLKTVSLDDLSFIPADVPDYPAIDQALKRLSALHPKLAEIAELRVYVRLSVRETAQLLRLSPTTVRQRWALARAWLQNQL